MKYPPGELSEGMRVLGPLARPLVFAAAGCLGPSACARPAPVVPLTATTTVVPTQVAAPAAPAPAPLLHDLRWQLRSGDGGAWADAPLSLHPFTVGRWECALSEVLSDDTLDASTFDLRRTRRLACTHATGATVQTQLGCTLHTVRSALPTAGLGSPAEVYPSTDASSAARELQIQLDGTPPLHVRCAPSEVVELTLTSRDKRTLLVLCREPRDIHDCTQSTAEATSSAPPAHGSP